jgi:molybdopterin-guanine dinucleotide biosynthesis protein A
MKGWRWGSVPIRSPLPFEVHDDDSSVRAPLAGLVAGLRLAAHAVVVVLPVDCPLVTPAFLRQLADSCEDAAVPQTGPLPGAYRRHCLPLLERRLAAGELALRGALELLVVQVVCLDPEILVNVNSRDDLSRLEARCGGGLRLARCRSGRLDRAVGAQLRSNAAALARRLRAGRA